MRRTFTATAGAAMAVALASLPLQAQGATELTSLLKVSDFAVPDAPAMQLVEVAPSAILRPQSFGSLAAAVSGFRGDEGQLVVPRNLGIEFSPALLASRNDAAYRGTNAFLAQSRISVATRYDSTGHTALAFGWRFSAVDDADDAYDDALQSYAETINLMLDSIRSTVGPGQPLRLSATQEQAVAAWQDSIARRIAERNWNADAVHLAIAARTISDDSLGANAKMDEVAAWGTFAKRLGETGQLLLGGRAASARDSTGDFSTTISLAGRAYYGSNGGKAFAEGSVAMREMANAQTALRLGVEFRLEGIGWIDAMWGVERGADRATRTVSTVRFKHAFGGL